MAKSTFTCFKIYTTTNSYPDSEKYIEEKEADILLPEIVEIKKMLASLIRKIKTTL